MEAEANPNKEIKEYCKAETNKDLSHNGSSQDPMKLKIHYTDVDLDLGMINNVEYLTDLDTMEGEALKDLSNLISTMDRREYNMKLQKIKIAKIDVKLAIENFPETLVGRVDPKQFGVNEEGYL